MGNSCYVDINLEINFVIWIEPEAENYEINQFSKELESTKTLTVKLFKYIDEAIDYLKGIKFQETKIVVNGGLYSELVRLLKANLEDLYVAPKIIVYTNDTEKFIETNKEYKNNDNLFYRFGGVAINFQQLKQFLKNERDDILETENKPKKVKEKSIPQLIIEYIDCKEKLMLPLLFKSLIDNVSKEIIKKYINILYQGYSHENDEIKTLLHSIEPMNNIPIEILSKYYVRLYTLSSKFQQDIIEIIKTKRFKGFLPFIQILYEGVKLRSLPLFKDDLLYKGCLLSNEDIQKIIENTNKKIKYLPSSIVYSTLFLTFSKDRTIAENNLIEEAKPLDFSKVLFILEKEDNLTYGLSSHCDLENISYFTDQKEVLFFPFSPFEIKYIKLVNLKREKIYEIKLLFLDKYLDFIENDKNLISNSESLPDSEFKLLIQEFGLIKKEKLNDCDCNSLYNSYKKYEEDIKKTKNEMKETDIEEPIQEQELKDTNVITKAKEKDIGESDIKFEIDDSIDENSIKDNIGFLYIGPEDINKDIQVINSFENVKSSEKTEIKKSEYQLKNDKEIRENIQIKINDRIINFSYKYRFENVGNYKIEYIIKKELTHTNYLFYNCHKLTKLYLANFDTQNVINMNNMFSGCKNLNILSISNFNTQNVTDMKNLFRDCNSLNNLNLSNFKTRNVTNMVGMFFNCKSLKNLDVSNFNTQNVGDMSEMFFGCSSLINLDLSNFNTQNVISMIGMFNGCTNLKHINLSNFNTQNVMNMYCMFCCCGSLKSLNLSNFKTQNVTNMYCMFLNCKSLKNLNLSNFDSLNVTDMNWMFNGCNSLIKRNIITKDIKIIKFFETQRVFIFNKKLKNN